VLAQPELAAQPQVIQVVTSSCSETIPHSRWSRSERVTPHTNVWLDWTRKSLEGPDPKKVVYEYVERLNVMQVNHEGMIRIHNPTKDKISHYQLHDHRFGCFSDALQPGETHFVTVNNAGRLSLLL
jgi:hypothetical protein